MSQDDLGRYVPPREQVDAADLAEESRDGDGASEPFDTRPYDSCFARVTVVKGQVVGLTYLRLETRIVQVDGALTEWAEVARFAADPKSEESTAARSFTGLGDECRWAWSITNGPVDFYVETTFER